MATNDVPGANPANNDTLHAGCWAEHSDGSLIVVYDVDDKKNRVIYEIFDMSRKPVPIAYKDAMDIAGFKKQFSWNPNKAGSIKWTWHDKTPFDWDKIIRGGLQDGPGYPSAAALITAASEVIRSHAHKTGQIAAIDSDIPDLGVERELTKAEKGRLIDQIRKSKTARQVFSKIQSAINTLRS